MRNSLFHLLMQAGARLIFSLAMILTIVQVIDAALGIKMILEMQNQGQPYGDYLRWIDLIAKLVTAFAWPVLLLALAMIIDRLDAFIGREGPRA